MKFKSHRRGKGNYSIQLAEHNDNTDFLFILFDHCIKSLRDGEACKELSDSQKSRRLLTSMLQAHSVVDIEFLDELPRDRIRRNKQEERDYFECEVCGVASDEVKLVNDPYEEDIYGVIEERKLCPQCYYELEQDI